jgi:glycerol kinase
MAGLGVGVWGSTDDLRETWRLNRRFDPGSDEARERAEAAYALWRKGVEHAKGWAD